MDQNAHFWQLGGVAVENCTTKFRLILKKKSYLASNVSCSDWQPKFTEQPLCSIWDLVPCFALALHDWSNIRIRSNQAKGANWLRSKTSKMRNSIHFILYERNFKTLVAHPVSPIPLLLWVVIKGTVLLIRNTLLNLAIYEGHVATQTGLKTYMQLVFRILKITLR